MFQGLAWLRPLGHRVTGVMSSKNTQIMNMEKWLGKNIVCGTRIRLNADEYGTLMTQIGLINTDFMEI
jgi:hypothetical protein